MRHFLTFARPDDELSGVCKVSARNIGWWIGFRPRNDIQNLEAKFGQCIGYGENVMIGSAYPNGSVVL